MSDIDLHPHTLPMQSSKSPTVAAVRPRAKQKVGYWAAWPGSMRFVVVALVALLPSIGWSAARYEGSWFTCAFGWGMGGGVYPWLMQTIYSEQGQLKMFSEWGSKYSFSGTAKVEGRALVIRGCSYYVDEPMESCDPDAPPVSMKLKLPLQRKWPSNVDAALKRQEAIYLPPKMGFDPLARRCERLIAVELARKENR